MTAQAEAGVWLVSECPIENGTLLKSERVVSLHVTADEALSEVRRLGKILRENDLRGYLYGYKFYPVPGLLPQQPAPQSEALTLRERIPIVYKALRSAVGYMEGEGWDTDEQETALHVLRLMMVDANAVEAQP